ncbi:MAG: 2-succinyl-5-enolpyruvyl-6-hydroxy-3-cyclohexene-1-carboxylic-acid synthase [Pleurocapsa sp.]
MIDFRNTNTVWASVLVETCWRLGLTTAVLCPGSRCSPLTIALARHPQIEAISILDERSAAFFALGKAKQTGLPTILVCTSGTAGANFYPAVIEAKESHIPLIILTADRPPELRNCHAGQTIDQIKLYSNYANWYSELAVPEAKMEMLRYLRQNIIQAKMRSLFPTPGVVHFNLPFREPLAPIPQPEIGQLQKQLSTAKFFAGISPLVTVNNCDVTLPLKEWQSCDRGIIIAGLAQPKYPELYCKAIAQLSKLLSFPVLAEALSPVRNYAALNPYLISSYDFILRDDISARKLVPDLVIQIGELPTSKQLRTWLNNFDTNCYIVDSSWENFDPLHRNAVYLNSSIEKITNSIDSEAANQQISEYCQVWQQQEIQTREKINLVMQACDTLYEGKAAWLLSQILPDRTPIFFANSMSVRNAEFFWQPNNKQIVPYFSRGANGIDGTLSTALGIAQNNLPGVLLTGDLALLHDTNGFLIQNKFQGHLTIVLINNNGGGIFEMLPISQFESSFEEYFATPQAVSFAKLAATYSVDYRTVNNWQQLQQLLSNLPTTGIRILELICDRKADVQFLKSFY